VPTAVGSDPRQVSPRWIEAFAASSDASARGKSTEVEAYHGG
jgi:hypothetical protein